MMKLVVWSNPYGVSYGGSMAFVVAETVEEARAILADANRAKSYRFHEYEQQRLPGVPVDVEPTRIVDIPCGEWHEWSE